MNKEHVVTIDTGKISDWDSFHAEFSFKMGFPDFYGNNNNAWIDCVSDIDGGMMFKELNSDESFTILVNDTENFGKRLPEVLNGFVNNLSFVNKRFIESGDTKRIKLLLQ